MRTILYLDQNDTSRIAGYLLSINGHLYFGQTYRFQLPQFIVLLNPFHLLEAQDDYLSILRIRYLKVIESENDSKNLTNTFSERTINP